MKIEQHNRLTPKETFLDETIFTTQNRYLGVRGCFEEGLKDNHDTMRGTYINGLYDTHSIHYGENAFGFPEQAETIVNIADAQGIIVKIGDTILSPKHCEILDLKRIYHLDKGYTERIITYKTPKDDIIRLGYKRLTSLIHKELFMIDATITSKNYDGPISIISTLDGDVKNYFDSSDPRLASSHSDKTNIKSIEINKNYGLMVTETNHTNFQIHTVVTHDQSFTYKKDNHRVIAQKNIHINSNESSSFKKFALYFNDLDHKQPKKEALALYEKLKGIDVYLSQEQLVRNYWNFSSIDIEDIKRPFLKKVIHYNLYQLYTSGGGNKRINIPAKGLSGEGYEGHTFWDTEIYMIPFFMQVDPSIAESLLSNRFGQMTEAKKEASRLGVNQGIKFPWRTISGRETSAYFLAGQAQFHINSDIAYAFIKNYQIHKNLTFFIKFGIPVLIETSRFFSQIVAKEKQNYHIHNVTGPDEYTTMVNDNFYTNSMVKFQLEFLIKFLKDHIDDCQEMKQTYRITDDEINLFQDIVDHLYLPYDETLGIDVQDDSFLKKERWDFSKTKSSEYPLLLHFHPLKIYRHQVLKQPDTVLAHYLLNNRPYEVMNRSFDFYESLTTHDSSLSRCIHAVQAARLGKVEKAYQYFLETVRLDLENVQRNTEYGLHVANFGGMYVTLLNGFLGLSIDEEIRIQPNLPKDITHLKMNIRVNKDCIINVDLSHKEIILTASQPVHLYIDDKLVTLKKNHIETYIR
ncbi:MAG: family 65 glycosyl hydrolase [Tenericutes bacterium]|jgi:alpha,alpha-trehalose phosphorylase|nr:family 65 glycosyl hydrolase [Mycoplasmatota bacterium]